MKKLTREEFSKIKGGNWISDIVTGAFGFLTDIGGKTETGIFGHQAMNSGADKVTVDSKNNKVEMDNTASNKLNLEIELEKLKMFGAPVPINLTLM